MKQIKDLKEEHKVTLIGEKKSYASLLEKAIAA